MPSKQLRDLPMLVFLAGFSLACHSEGLSHSVTSPDFDISLPNIPSLKMEQHPLHASRPHLRYQGSEGPYSVSVMTPSADAGMTATECASSTIKQLPTRPGVPPLENIQRVRVNGQTYAAIYSSTIAGHLVLQAHLLSAARNGTHCIEVHVSKMTKSRDDIGPWFKSFASANIEVR